MEPVIQEQLTSTIPNPFQKLSKQILWKIFSKIPPRSIQRIRAVCSDWKTEIEKFIVIGIGVNNDNYIWTLNCWKAGYARIRNFTLLFSDLILFAETIRHLEFSGIVISYNLIRFLMECNMVQSLKFDKIMLDNERGIKCPEGLTLPNVKSLNINLKCHVFPTADEMILINFLQQIEFGQLEKVVIHSAESANNHWGAIQQMGPAFTAEVGASLDKVRVPVLPSKIKSTAFLEFMIKNSESLKQILISGSELRLLGQPIEDFNGMIEFVQAEEFAYSIRTAGVFTGDESLLIECQKNLKKVDVQVDSHSWPALEKAIKASGETLTVAKIRFMTGLVLDNPAETPAFLHRDAGIFRECTKLENLEIGNRINSIQIINLDTLPGTIQSLVIGGPVTTEGLLLIASRLRQLKAFSLYHNLAMENMFGFTVFGSFVSIPTFRNLILKRSRFDQLTIMAFCKSREGIHATFSVHGNDENWGTLKCTISSKFFELNKVHEPQPEPEPEKSEQSDEDSEDDEE